MEMSETVQELVDEGQKALERGDRAQALANFVVATQLSPEDEYLWLQRVQATDDPHDAAECYEQILKINPNNVQARDLLLFSRLDSLQEEAKVTTHPGNIRKPSPLVRLFGSDWAGNRWRLWVVLSLLVFLSVCGLGVVLAGLVMNSAGEATVSAYEPFATPTVLQMPPTWTPGPTLTVTPAWVPTYAPAWRAIRNVTIRSGPSVAYRSMGILSEGTNVVVTSRSPDAKFVQIEYADGKRGWVSAEFLNMTPTEIAAVPTASVLPTLAAAPKPTLKPTVKPTDTPIPQPDFTLGRPAELVADCSKSWKVMGTIYDSQGGGRRLNGVLVRVWAFNQLQGTVSSGSQDNAMPGYWEWSFNRDSEVVGQVAVVRPDGSLRSQPVGFHLTTNCEGAGAVNQTIIDFVGK